MATPTLIDYSELLEQLQNDPAAVTDEQLTETDGAIADRLNDLRPKVKDGSATDEELDEVMRLGDQLETLRTTIGEREQASAERTSRAQAVLDGVQDPDREGEESAEGDEGTEGEGGEGEGVEEGAEGAEAVAATGRRPRMGEMGRQPGTPKPRIESRAEIALTAAADVAGFSAGQTITAADVPRALANRLNSIRGVRGRGAGGDGEMLTVCTFTADIPAERMLGSNVDENTRKIDRVSDARAIVAAGGVCAPFTVDYSIDVAGVTDEPIKDSLPTFGAERAGVQVRRDMDAAGAGPLSATGEWTLDDDAKVGTSDAPDPKPVWEVPCYPFIEAEVRAFTLQLQFSNILGKFDPESVAAAEQAALIAHARYCENERYRTMLAGSKQITVADQVSAVVDLLVALDKAQAYLRYRRRLADTARLRMYLPRWVKDMIRADLTRGMRTTSFDTLAVADAAIEGWFSARNVNVTWFLDGLPASSSPAVAAQQYGDAGAGTVVPDFPDQIDAVLFPEGEWKRLDAGTLDLGVVRDSGLIEMNRYRTFTESFEQVFHKGIESLRVTASVNPTGMTAGQLDTSALS